MKLVGCASNDFLFRNPSLRADTGELGKSEFVEVATCALDCSITQYFFLQEKQKTYYMLESSESSVKTEMAMSKSYFVEVASNTTGPHGIYYREAYPALIGYYKLKTLYPPHWCA